MLVKWVNQNVSPVELKRHIALKDTPMLVTMLLGPRVTLNAKFVLLNINELFEPIAKIKVWQK